MTTKQKLTPRQTAYLHAYANPTSLTFGNAYRSALVAGYTDQTARNITHLRPVWLTENIGQISRVIKPEELMQQLTDVIRDQTEPTIIRLKATELAMKAYSMTASTREKSQATVNVNIDLTS